MQIARVLNAYRAKAPDLSLKTVEGAGVRMASLWPERPLALIFFEPLGGNVVVDLAVAT